MTLLWTGLSLMMRGHSVYLNETWNSLQTGEWKLPLVIWMWKGCWKTFHIWLTNEWMASEICNEVRSCIDELSIQWIGCVGLMAYGLDISSSKNAYWLPWRGSMVHWCVGISVPSYMVSYTRRWKGIFMSYFLYYPVRWNTGTLQCSVRKYHWQRKP
jgi:hypothetical protein